MGEIISRPRQSMFPYRIFICLVFLTGVGSRTDLLTDQFASQGSGHNVSSRPQHLICPPSSYAASSGPSEVGPFPVIPARESN